MALGKLPALNNLRAQQWRRRRAGQNYILQKSQRFSISFFRYSADSFTLSSLRPRKVSSAARLTGGH